MSGASTDAGRRVFAVSPRSRAIQGRASATRKPSMLRFVCAYIGIYSESGSGENTGIEATSRRRAYTSRRLRGLSAE
jgi:hypothetical protein